MSCSAFGSEANQFVKKVLDPSSASPGKGFFACPCCCFQLEEFIPDRIVKCDVCDVVDSRLIGAVGCSKCNYNLCNSCRELSPPLIVLLLNTEQQLILKRVSQIPPVSKSPVEIDNTNYDLGD